MNHNMQSNIDSTIIQQLLTDSQKDGIQKLVVGAVICINNKFLLIERVLSDFMGGFVEIPSGTVETGEDPTHSTHTGSARRDRTSRNNSP